MAFGDGEVYAQYFFYQKLGPALKSVLASTEGPFAEIFRALTATGPVGQSSRLPVERGAERRTLDDSQARLDGDRP